MSDENKHLEKAAVENEIAHLTILRGDAPKQHNPQPVSISGNIDAPSLFIEGRKKDFADSQRHCMVSKTDGTIVLHLNEQSVVDKYTVSGKIEIGKKFEALGINSEKGYNPEELANKLKLLRSIFAKKMEHATICATLRNLKADINRTIEQLDDRRGNVSDNFKQTVESNMPDAITLKLPLLEGEDPVEFEVNVILEANGSNQIVCYLESIDASEMIEELFAQRVEEEVDKIKEFVTVIYH